MKSSLTVVVVLGFWALFVVYGPTESVAMDMPRSTPEEQGIPASAILAFLDRAEAEIESLHSVVLLRHGHQVAAGWWAPYAADTPHRLFSLSKIFTSTAVGLALEEGRLDLDDTVISFFPEDTPEEVGDKLAGLRVRQLLTMTTGHQDDTLGALLQAADGNWVRAFLAQEVVHLPGTHFLYNNGATFMLSAIVQQATGMTVLDYLKPRVFLPLGIRAAQWQTNPQGINTGGWGLSLKTEDIARLGQLYLQQGRWNGRRVLPESWVAAATGRQVTSGCDPDDDWHQGYGYQFWQCRHHAFRGDGAFGQFCVVMPEQDAVVAVTAGTPDMQGVLNLIWDELLTAMEPHPLPPDPQAQDALRERLQGLHMAWPQGAPTSPQADGFAARRYVFQSNPLHLRAITFTFADTGATLELESETRKEKLACGYGVWRRGVTSVSEEGPQPVAAAGAWTDATTYRLALCYYQTPFVPIWTCAFAGDQLTLRITRNVAFGPLQEQPLVGRTTKY